MLLLTFNNTTGLREMYDNLEFNVNNLKDLDVYIHTYSSLLIAIIFDCIPQELRIKVSKSFGSKDWNLDGAMEIIKLKSCE